MRKNLLKLLALFLLAVSLAACGLLPEKIDETASWPAGKLYREAKDEMRSGNYEKAIEYYEKLESRYPFGVFAQQAQIDIAYAYYRDNEPAQALAAVERFIKLHPNHPNIDYMYYLRGLINFNDRVGLLNFAFRQDLSERDPKAAQDAFDSFKLLVTRYPDSVYSKDAIYRMKYLVTMLAKYEIHVAKYYYRRGAYLAAANRAQRAINNYPDSFVVEEALYILAESYKKLGLYDLSSDANRIFKQNYPDSKIPYGGNAKENPWWQFW